MNWNQLSLVSILLAFCLISCDQDDNTSAKFKNKKELKDKLIEFNKSKAGAEDRIISDFVKVNFPNAKTSETGIRYLIYSAGDEKKAQENDKAIIKYRIESLGKVLYYSTEQNGPEKLWLGHEDIPSGLNEGLSYMAEGDSAVFILPSNRAYGFTGNQSDIPQNAILVYHVELIDLE